MEDYYGGSFMLVWDRTQDRCNRFHKHITDSGSISINLKSRQALARTVTVIIYATYSKDLVIDGDKVLTDAFRTWIVMRLKIFLVMTNTLWDVLHQTGYHLL